jgi:ketosteroid isomerase-like protein
MSEENVELVREVNAVFNDAPGDVERWLPYYEGDAEFHMPPEWPEGRVYRGHDGIRALANAWIGSFDEYRWDEERLIDEGDCVVALWHHRGRARGTNVWLERQIGSVWYLRDQRIAKVLAFFSWVEALEAAGVRE